MHRKCNLRKIVEKTEDDLDDDFFIGIDNQKELWNVKNEGKLEQNKFGIPNKLRQN